MDKRIEEYWIERYPNLFSAYHLGVHVSPMARGFTCGNGWFNIMDQLWEELSCYKDLTLAQVKEKFGVLSVYPVIGNKTISKEIHKLIDIAMSVSSETCEMCGKEGKRRSDGWIFTLCDECVELEGSEKWTKSEGFGNTVVANLGLRTTCETKEDHLPNFDFSNCIVCGIKWRDI